MDTKKTLVLSGHRLFVWISATVIFHNLMDRSRSSAYKIRKDYSITVRLLQAPTWVIIDLTEEWRMPIIPKKTEEETTITT